MDIELRNILKSSTVLLVEDDIKVLEKFSRLLGIYIGKVYTASNGEDALQLYKRLKPSFIITDIEMPKMNGLKFIELLRKENNTIPIIIMSAYSNKEYLLNSIKLQLIDYLLKPLDNDNLIKNLEKVSKILKENKLSNIIEINDNIKYNSIDKSLIICKKEVILTSIESEIFELLLLNRGNIVTKQVVENKIYVFKEMGNSALKNTIYKLRKKLIDKDIIISVNKLGYKIDESIIA